MNPTDGHEIWSRATGISSFVVAGKVVFLTSGYSVHALKASNGAQIWSYQTARL
jgi:outer membrane protein assembly factor BamB